MNSTVGLIFNEKVAEKWCLWIPWTVHGCIVYTKSQQSQLKKKEKKEKKERKMQTQNTILSKSKRHLNLLFFYCCWWFAMGYFPIDQPLYNNTIIVQ